MAPEIVSEESKNYNGNYDIRIDIWSLGMIWFELLNKN